jgi:thioesterase domain-containing protein
VARGYHARPELTAERFLPDPFAPEPGARMYRTGDLGRWLADGSLAYLGRNDQQVKLRGLRIELGEIEAALRLHAAVGETAVLLREDAPGERQLVAYCVAADAVRRDAVDPALPLAWREHLLARLPEFMVPAAFVQLPALPLSPNGKLARERLPPPGSMAYAQAEYEAPDGEIEALVAQAWQSLLGTARIGRHDDFFRLGGHSLLLLQVAARLAAAGIVVPVPALFRHSTVAALAAHIAGTQAEADEHAAVPLREGASPPLFLAHDGSGLLLYAHKLADAIDTPLAIFGLPAIPLHDAQAHTVPDLARRLLRLVREVQPRGPYRLAGWSFGGLLAHEMAAMLRADGEAVEFLAMLDSHHRPADAGHARTLHDEKAHLLALMQVEAFGVPDLQAALEGLKAQADALDLGELLRRAEATRRALMPAHLAGLPETEVAAYLHRQHALHGAGLAHRASPLDIDVHLVRAEEGPHPGALGWEHVVDAARLHVATVPGDHHSMLRGPNLAVLARALSAWLAKAVATTAGSR